jgi:glycosyltransferase involved in cell wall biosynthesis
MKNKFLLSCHGRFHYFEIAKVLYKNDQLSQIISGYPWFKLKNENLPKNKVTTVAFGIFTILPALLGKISFSIFKKLIQILHNIKAIYIDKRSSNFLDNSDVFLSLSGSGLETGKLFKKRNKIYICERASTHILEQQEILRNEYLKYNIHFNIDAWTIDRELKEYNEATFVLVPSNFAKDSFLKHKIHNLEVIPYAANLDKFYSLPKEKNKKYFDILYVGSLSLRKGLPYLLDAYNNFKHPNKRLHLIGTKSEDFYLFKKKINFENTKIYGHVPHEKLVEKYNMADVFILPSIEDGYAFVITQALACGTPVISSTNTGSSQLVTDYQCGYVVPPMDSSSILEKLYELNDNKYLLEKFSQNALKSREITYDTFVHQLNEKIKKYSNN